MECSVLMNGSEIKMDRYRVILCVYLSRQDTGQTEGTNWWD